MKDPHSRSMRGLRSPGWNLPIPESRIKWHLDQDCKSKAVRKGTTRKKISCTSTPEDKSEPKRAILSACE